MYIHSKGCLFNVAEYDPNPLLSLAKRKRRNSGTSCDSKDRRISSEAPNSTNGISNTSESGSKTTLENSSLSEKQVHFTLLFYFTLLTVTL